MYHSKRKAEEEQTDTQKRRRQCEDKAEIAAMWQQAKEWWQPQQLKEMRKDSLELLERNLGFHLVTLILTFWPPEL